MKKLLVALVLMLVAVMPSLYAGSYTLDNGIIHLQGDTSAGKTFWLESQVKIQFNHLKLAWDHSGKVDRVRYDISCLDGKVILQNVKYIDKAVDGAESVRWQQSTENLNNDFSFIKDNRNSKRPNNVKYSTKMAIEPSDRNTAKVEFHFHASGRHYIVTWEPKANKIYSSWETLR